MTEAALVLAPLVGDVVVFGAVAVEVALSEAAVSITPTRDIDLVVATERADAVVARLEAADLRRSDLPHEEGFTWVKGDLKVQLVRSFHPHPAPVARRLPSQPKASMGQHEAHQTPVAFRDDPSQLRFVAVSAACVIALKREAFGRRRYGEEHTVQRDFHDVYLLLREAAELVLEDYDRAGYDVRTGLELAVGALADDAEAAEHAAREAADIGGGSVATARADVRRTATRFRRRLHQAHPQAAGRHAKRQEPLK